MSVEIILLPDPYTMDWPQWADTVAGYNPELVEWVDPDDSWQDFARRFAEAVQEAPKPEGHSDWQSWALALKQVLQV